MAFPSRKVPMTAEALTFAVAFAELDQDAGQEAFNAASGDTYTRLSFAANLAALALDLAGSRAALIARVNTLRQRLGPETVADLRPDLAGKTVGDLRPDLGADQ
jgi:hypothetical protein